MGSYNMSCFASKHTIACGDKTYLIPIYQQATRNPVVLSLGDMNFTQYGTSGHEAVTNTFWTYAGPVIEATYDDCGQFTLIDSPANIKNIVHFFSILHEKLFKVAQGEDSYHEPAFDFQSLYNPSYSYSFAELASIWNEMWNSVEESRLFILHKEQPRQLQFATLHHKAFDYFETYCNQWKQDGKTLRKTFDSFVKEPIIPTIHPIKEMQKYPDMTDVFTNSLNMGADMISNLQGMRMGNCFNYWSLYDNKKEIIEIITQFVQNNPKAKVFDQATIDQLWTVSESVLVYRMIHIGLSHFNIQLTPMGYAGQDEDNETGKAYLKLIKAVSK